MIMFITIFKGVGWGGIQVEFEDSLLELALGVMQQCTSCTIISSRIISFGQKYYSLAKSMHTLTVTVPV